MEIKLGKFKSEDVFVMTTLLSKIGLKKMIDVFGQENVMKMMSDIKSKDEKKDNDEVAILGMGMMFQIAQIIFENLERCQDEIYLLLSHVTSLSIDEIKELDAEIFFEYIVKVIQMEQFKDFFKVASKFISSTK